MPNSRQASDVTTPKWLLRAAIALAILAAAAIGVEAQSASGANSATVQQISSDPYTNNTSQHRTQVEPDMYSFGNTVVTAFQSGRFFSGGGSSNIAWATSVDDGGSWTNGFLPGTTVFATPAGPAARATDPAVGFDRKSGTWLIASLVCAPPPDTCDSAPNSVMVSRSSDGITWGLPVAVNTGDDDKEWIGCDNGLTSPFFGRCYMSWNDIGNARTLTSVSTDGGSTWGAGVPAIQMSGVQPLVQPNGALIIAGDGGSGIVAIRSTDGGVTYSQPTLVASLNSHSPSGMRAPALPSAAMDGAGNVYVAWADCRFRSNCSSNDIVMSTSPDGINWPAAPARIPVDSAVSDVDHFIPGLGIDLSTAGASTRLGLSYYYLPTASCAVDACQLDVGFISSDDVGATWTSPTQLNAAPMSLSWLANTDWPGHMVGDYISTVSANGQFLSVFALANAPAGSTLDEAMVVASVATGSPTPAVSPTPTPTPTPTSTASPTATPSPTPSCPNGLVPPWPVPTNDSDCDGFTSARETFVGTDPNKGCAADNVPNNEPPPDAWPVDFNNDQLSGLSDVSRYSAVFGSHSPGPPYDSRFDLNGDGRITLPDIAMFSQFFGKRCSP
jgi:hypothetical protein